MVQTKTTQCAYTIDTLNYFANDLRHDVAAQNTLAAIQGKQPDYLVFIPNTNITQTKVLSHIAKDGEEHQLIYHNPKRDPRTLIRETAKQLTNNICMSEDTNLTQRTYSANSIHTTMVKDSFKPERKRIRSSAITSKR